MKLKITIFSFAAIMAFAVTSPSKADAGKKLKNLKVLSPKLGKKVGKGMKHLTKGLGVKCVACHVKGKMEKDDVAAKEQSRTFIKVVLEHPEKRQEALKTLMKEMKLEKVKNEAKIWKAFDTWKAN
jgi:hypothetical protein